MSRCFPYPPRGYSKSGATYEALIESIKLQKESVKAVKDKSERKKEKREKKERKEKKREEKRKAEEKQAIKKNPNEFLLNSKETRVEKAELKTFSENPNEFLLNSKETRVEKVEIKTVSEIRTDLEKSDLTEEHCEPTTSQKPSYSSDSTNSNKRKRDEVAVIDGSSGLGKSIKIRLPKKHKTDSEPQTEVLCAKSGKSDTPCFPGADARLNSVSSNRTTGVPVTSGRENNPVNGHPLSQTKPTLNPLRPAAKCNDIQRLQFGSKQFASSPSARPPLTHLKHDMPSSYSNKTEVSVPISIPVPAPSRSNKSDVEVLSSARQPPVSSYAKPLLPLNQKGLSSADINKTNSAAAAKRPICEITALDNSYPSSSVKRKEISEILNTIPKNAAPDNIASTRIENKNDNLITETPTKPKLTRHEKKLQKKFSKYQKVIKNWAPPVFEPPRLPVDDEDWLSRRGPKVAKTVETSREKAPSSLWQPCARFLVEADIYALPFTVPF